MLVPRSGCASPLRKVKQMDDKAISKLLEDMLRSEHAPPLTDSVVDAFLASEVECPEGIVNRVRARFVERVLADLRQEPVRKVEEKLSFGRWVEQARENARLSRQDVGAAIGKDQSFIESVESGFTLPWGLKTTELARIVSLFRLHVDAVSELVSRSFALSSVRIRGEVLARSHRGRMSQERGSSTRRALDMFLAQNVKDGELNEEVTNCLGALRDELRRMGALELLS
jgi:transcriptional regulator with XRE-family HTH domain